MSKSIRPDLPDTRLSTDTISEDSSREGDCRFAAGLYIVATPIGNLADITERARSVLAAADIVACEDTRVTGRLLHHLGLKKTMRRYHDHSGEGDRENLLSAAREGVGALVSDAGTPLISDPGYKLVRAAGEAGVMVTSVPGASAAIAALTLSGLPTDRFLFEGFLPSKSGQRVRALQKIAAIEATLIFYESGPRLAAMLSDAHDILGDRQGSVIREITKKFEEKVAGRLAELAERYTDAPPKGEIVVVIGAPEDDAEAPTGDALDALILAALAKEPISRAASSVARAHGLDRRTVYARAVELKAQ